MRQHQQRSFAPKYLDPTAYAVVNGGVPETTHLLDFKWDDVFFTGGGTVEKIVATAAAMHTAPHTLELGSKNPVVIDNTVDVPLAAKRIIWGFVPIRLA